MIDDSTLWATDALLDSLALGELPEQDDDRGLQLLAALVLDVSADLPTSSPVPDEVRVRRSRLLRLAPRTGVALAAAVAVVSTGGVAAASVNAGPTSALFPLHQVLTGQPQLDGSQRQALEVRDKLKSATRALAAGKVDRAQRDVSAAARRISKVAEVDGRRDLTAQWVVVNRQVTARSVTPVVPAKPTQTVVPTPTHSPSPTPKPVVSPSPTGSPSPTTHSPRPAPTTSPAPTGAAPRTSVPVTAAPTTAQPSGTGSGTPQPSVTGSAGPSATGTPEPSVSSTSGQHSKGSKTPTPPPSAAEGSPVDPIVITPAPTETPSQPPQSPNDQMLPMPSDPPAAASSAPAAGTPTPSAAVVLPSASPQP